MIEERMIQTDRLLLRPHGLNDFEAMAAMFAEPAVFRFLGGTPFTREEVWHRLMRYAGHWSLMGYGLFAIVERSTGAFVGETGFADFHRGLGGAFDPFPEAAWVLSGSVHGQGYASEAVAAAHAWHDATCNPLATVCIIRPENVASIRVAEKVGYAPFGEADYRGGAMVMLQRRTV